MKLLLVTLAGITCLTREVLGIECEPGTYFPHPLFCRSFYLCNLGSNAIHFDCPDGLHFNLHNEKCDWPANAKCSLEQTKENANASVTENFNITESESTENPPDGNFMKSFIAEGLKTIFGGSEPEKVDGRSPTHEVVIEKVGEGNTVKTNETQSKSKTDKILLRKKERTTKSEPATTSVSVTTEDKREESIKVPLPFYKKPTNDTNKKTNENENKKEKRTATTSTKPEKNKEAETPITNSNSRSTVSVEDKKENMSNLKKETKKEILFKSELVNTEENGKEIPNTKDELPENPFKYSREHLFDYGTFIPYDPTKKDLDVVGYKTDDQEGSKEEIATNDTTVLVKSKKVTNQNETSASYTEPTKTSSFTTIKDIEIPTSPSASSAVTASSTNTKLTTSSS